MISANSSVNWESELADVTVAVACCILVLLFGLQHMGTRRVSRLFAPIILAWLLCNASIGMYNLITWNPSILKALSPYYMYYFFKMDGKEGWIALGGVLLCITGLSLFSTMFSSPLSSGFLNLFHSYSCRILLMTIL